MADFISVAEAVAESGYTRDWIQKLAQRGEIKARKLHQRAWLIDRKSLETYMASPKARKLRKDGGG